MTDKNGCLYALVELIDSQELSWRDTPSKKLDWHEAKAWAKSQGADLPTRAEIAVLTPLTRNFWVWTNETTFWDFSYAWRCGFFGRQYYGLKRTRGDAIAVRRLPLQSFSALVEI